MQNYCCLSTFILFVIEKIRLSLKYFYPVVIYVVHLNMITNTLDNGIITAFLWQPYPLFLTKYRFIMPILLLFDLSLLLFRISVHK